MNNNPETNQSGDGEQAIKQLTLQDVLAPQQDQEGSSNGA
jgi:hypothetical protein